MNKEVSYRFLEDENILVRHFHILGSVENILRKWKEDVEAGVVHRDLLGVVTILEHPEEGTTFEEFKKLVQYYTANKELFGHIKMAQVIQTPVIVFPKIFEENYDFKSQGFSTLEAALEWMRIV